MLDFKNLVGMMMQSGMSRSGTDRMKHALGEQGLGGQGGLLGSLLGGSLGGGGLLSALGGGGKSGGGLGGLAAMAESMLGGGKTSKSALGGGVMALLGSLAMSAITSMNRPVDANGTTSMPLGLREPQDDQEERELQKSAMVVLRAMINAAKADGQIDQEEMQRIVGKLQEAGADQDARNFVRGEMGKPMDMAGIIRDVYNPEVAAQVYAASLLAIEVDTPAEQNYMRQLAKGLRLEPEVVSRIHQILGV